MLISVLTQGCVPTRTDLIRSEEHTSELQSRLQLVCRLLLEKKKQYASCSPADRRVRALCEPRRRLQASSISRRQPPFAARGAENARAKFLGRALTAIAGACR